MTHANRPPNHLLRVFKACYNCRKGPLVMSVSINLPPTLEESLRRDIADLDQVAKESLLVELYRHERITKHELATALGIDRFAANDVLNRFGVTEDLPSADEIRQQVDAMNALLERESSR